MTGIVKNLVMIRQHGKIYHYFDVAKRRDDWTAIAFAHGRKWVIEETIDNGLYETFKCRPRFIKKDNGGYEWETDENGRELE